MITEKLTSKEKLQIRKNKLQIRKNKLALRNSKKRNVTTKSFNNSKHGFVPQVKAERNPDAELFKQLKNIGKIPKDTKFITWLMELKNV